jgi:hypothetical protein
MDNKKAGSVTICHRCPKQKGSSLSQTAHYQLKKYQLSIDDLSIIQKSQRSQYQISVPVRQENDWHQK